MMVVNSILFHRDIPSYPWLTCVGDMEFVLSFPSSTVNKHWCMQIYCDSVWTIHTRSTLCVGAEWHSSGWAWVGRWKTKKVYLRIDFSRANSLHGLNKNSNSKYLCALCTQYWKCPHNQRHEFVEANGPMQWMCLEILDWRKMSFSFCIRSQRLNQTI